MRSAGFAEFAVQEVAVTARFADAAAHFEHVSTLAGSLATALAAADEDRVEAVRATTAELVERFGTPDGLAIPGRALLCTARRPAR